MTTANKDVLLERAEAAGVDVSDDPNKDELVERLDGAGVSTDVDEPDQDDEPDQKKAESTTSQLAVGYPTLTSGSVDQAVVELTTWLQAEGHDVPIGNTVTPDVMHAVVAHRRSAGIEDDPGSVPGGESARDNWIGPETWAAMKKAQQA